MKPDAYMPFYFREFFEAMKGRPDIVFVAYLKALGYNWGHMSCRGLEDDSESLRRICEVDKSDWVRVREVIFDNHEFFVLGDDGRWHQKFQDSLWGKQSVSYSFAVERAKAGASARWGINPKRGRKH